MTRNRIAELQVLPRPQPPLVPGQFGREPGTTPLAILLILFWSIHPVTVAQNLYDSTVGILDANVSTILAGQNYTPDFYRDYRDGNLGHDRVWGQFVDSNIRNQECTYVLAFLYQEPKSRYYHDPEILKRVLASFDQLVRAQGATGGFAENRGWIGVDDMNPPDFGRLRTGEPPTAFTMYAIARAFTLLYRDSMVFAYDKNMVVAENVLDQKGAHRLGWSVEDALELTPEGHVTYRFVPQKDFDGIILHGHAENDAPGNAHVRILEDSTSTLFDQDVTFPKWIGQDAMFDDDHSRIVDYTSTMTERLEIGERFQAGHTYELMLSNRSNYALYLYLVSSSDLSWVSDLLDVNLNGIWTGQDTEFDERWSAYIQMFRRAIDFYSQSDTEHDGRGHAPNQDVVDLNALYELNEAAKILSHEGYPPKASDDKISQGTLASIRDEILDTIDPAIRQAQVKNEYGKWFTRNYLPLECCNDKGVGWDSNYGAIIAHFLYVYSTHDAVVRDFLPHYYDAIQYFLTPESVTGIAQMQWDGAWEGNTSRRVGGTYMHFASMLDPQNPVATRMHYLLLTHVNWDVAFHVGDPFKYDLFEYVDFLRYYHEPFDPGYRLPNEKSDDYTWYDSEARVLIVRADGKTDYIAFDWGEPQRARVNEHDMDAAVADGARYYGFDQQTDRFYGLAHTPPGSPTPRVSWQNLSPIVTQHLTQVMTSAAGGPGLLNTVDSGGHIVGLGEALAESLAARPIAFALTPSLSTVQVSVTRWETTGAHAREWTETAEDAGTVTEHRLGDFPGNTPVIISMDGQPLETVTSNADGSVDFSYVGGFAIPTHTFSANVGTTPVAMLGDVSGDGTISACDASLILQNIKGLVTLPDPRYPRFTLRTADVSGDGQITAIDAAYTLQYLVGKIIAFPVETSRE